MNIQDLVNADHVIARMRADGKDGLLNRMTSLAAAWLSRDPHMVLRAVRAREELGSTGIGDGVALPHARLEGLERPFGMFVSLHRPVPFDSIDQKPVDLVFLLLTPRGENRVHLEALACASRALRNGDVVRNARRAENPHALYAAIIAPAQ